MSCALCPDYHFCELKKSGLDKNATFIVHDMMWACNSDMVKYGNEYAVSHNDVYLRVKIERA